MWRWPIVFALAMSTACAAPQRVSSYVSSHTTDGDAAERTAEAAARKSARVDLPCSESLAMRAFDLPGVRHLGIQRPEDLLVVEGCGRRVTYVLESVGDDYRVLLIGNVAIS